MMTLQEGQLQFENYGTIGTTKVKSEHFNMGIHSDILFM